MPEFNFSSVLPAFNLSLSTTKIYCFQNASFIKLFAYVIILLVSLVGNSMIVAVMTKGRLLRKNIHLFLLNMAIADLVVTVVYMPRMVVMMLYGNSWLVTGTFGLILCRTVPFLHHLAILVSVFTILGATLDRFFAIVFPLHKIMTKCVGKAIVIVIWLVSAFLRSPYVITPVLKRKGSVLFCNGNLNKLFGSHIQVYENFLVVIYCCSLTVTVALYSIAILKLKRKNVPGISNHTAAAKRDQASKKLLNMLFVILFCFILCWFLYFFALSILPRPLSCETLFFRFFLAHSNSALNPCILAIFDHRYWNGYRSILRKFFPCLKAPNSSDRFLEISLTTVKNRSADKAKVHL